LPYDNQFKRVASSGQVVAQSTRPSVSCREIRTDDIAGLVNLLSDGFRERPRRFWVRAFERLAHHPTPPGLPKYGYLLESAEGRSA
jgi:hypothetical protein